MDQDKDRIAERARTKAREQRAYPVALEVRSKKDATVTLGGYASVTEEPYEMYDMFGPYSEVMRRGAFTKTLNENPQTQLLLNHGGLSMAYTNAGTLRMSEDVNGLYMEADVNTARTDVRDMVLAIEDGAVDEMSFGFRVIRATWSPDFDQRDITEVSLHKGDVSVVNFGANPATSVGAIRAMDFESLPEDEARALMERLQKRFIEPPKEYPLSLYAAKAALL